MSDETSAHAEEPRLAVERGLDLLGREAVVPLDTQTSTPGSTEPLRVPIINSVERRVA